MKDSEIQTRVDNVWSFADGDDEQAHAAEDALWRDVLQAIADKKVKSPSRAAHLALQTSKIHFARWCA